MPWPELQREFAGRLRDPDAAVPSAVAPTGQTPSGKRFNVYRNNVAVSLVEALAAGYPVVHQLVGEEFFSAMARVFVADNLPSSPVMLAYGGQFPDFIADFEPAANVPYLADVARLEWAWATAYHAPDCNPVAIDVLQALPPERLEHACLGLNPSLQLVASAWPAASIWQAHQGDADPQAAMQDLAPAPEHAMIVRPAYDIDIRIIPPAALNFYRALQEGASLGEAAAPLAEAEAAEMGAMLQLLFASGSVVAMVQA